MKLQRYYIEPGSESMQEFPDGEYIKLSDVLALLDPSEIGSDHGDNCLCGMCTVRTTINAERARLRAALGAE